MVVKNCKQTVVYFYFLAKLSALTCFFSDLKVVIDLLVPGQERRQEKRDNIYL